ncbi:hypothetical protein CHS0354_017072 [Potamilus streckersoni]|uniref:Novel STAND NTPase 3 domain-containing protein n=1 Tax=Potamilus streckersoni TaxID=2493646 RepID=A0AAE0S790_9BIVA|nr:hypothetical protein CHS0354_017072 [Potamilus streckersoni]
MHAFHRAVDILKEKGVLILSGGPGEGKTTTAAAVILHTSTPKRCLVVRSPDDWKHVDPLLFDVIFIDNIFGEVNVNIELVNKWMPYFEDMWAMVRENKTSFIIALREHILENCKPKLKRAELFKPEFCQRLSSSAFETIPVYSVFLSVLNSLPLMIMHIQEEGQSFFRKPFKFLEKCLDSLYGDNEEEFLPFALLWIMHNRNQKVTKELLSSSVGLRSVLDSLDIHGINSRSLETS